MSKFGYDLKKIKAMVFDVDGVLSPSTVPLAEDGTPVCMANVKVGFAMQLAVIHGYKIAILSGGVSEIIERRFEIIGVKDVYMGIGDKLPVLKRWMEENGLQPEEVAYIGDDLPDYGCIKYAGLSIAPRDAAVEIKDAAKHISSVDGGYGVARELIEEVMRVNGEWMKSEKCFVW